MNAAQVELLFARALTLEGVRREALLAAECAGDDDLRRELESLLAAHEAMGEFMARPAAGALGALVVHLEPGEVVGGYRVVRLVDEGGSGAVYEAIQANPERRVALKVMRAGPASETERQRFAQEAQILARLRHPAIATIYEAGVEERDEGRLSWFALEYVEGSRTLLEYAGAVLLPTRDRLRLFAQVCDAIHHGHQQGLLHRDIKPGNILVDAGGRPKVIDFGIAKAIGDRSATEVAGTPPYMSPEQAAGGPPDVRSDVYSLGVLLDELLGESSTPMDLRSIAHKACARDPEKRYVSAAALGEEVRRYLAWEPVTAYRHGPLYRIGKFARRQRLAFGAILTVIAVSITATVVSTRLAIGHARARREAEFQSYVANIAAASAALRAGDVAEARRRLAQAPAQLRGWEWRHFMRRVDLSSRTITWPGVRIWTGSLSRDGSLIAALGLDKIDPLRRTVRVWDRESGIPVRTTPDSPTLRSLTLSGDGALLALGHVSGAIEVQQTRSGQTRQRLKGHTAEVNAMVFDPAGQWLVSASRDKTVRVWSLRDGAALHLLRGHRDRVISVCLSPDGRQVLSGGRSGEIRIWNLETGESRSLKAHRSSVEGVDWSRDGTFFASACRDGTAAIWDVATLRRRATLKGHQDVARDIAIAPDGKTVATASYDRTVRLFDVASGDLRACFRGHGQPVARVAYTPDSKRLVSIARDGTLKEWPVVADRPPVPTLSGHADMITNVVLPGAGEFAVTGSVDGSVRLWESSSGKPVRTIHAGQDSVCALASGGGLLFAAFNRGKVRAWSLPDGIPRWEARTATALATFAGGRRLIRATSRGEVVIHDSATGAVLRRWQGPQACVRAVAADRRGDLIVTVRPEGAISVRDRQGRLLATRRTGRWQTTLAISPDDGTVAVGDYEGNIVIYDLENLAERDLLPGHVRLSSVVYWPDGRRLAAGGLDGTIRLWDPARRQIVAVLQGHRYAVLALALSRDGRRLLSGAGRLDAPDCVAKIWETDDLIRRR